MTYGNIKNSYICYTQNTTKALVIQGKRGKIQSCGNDVSIRIKSPRSAEITDAFCHETDNRITAAGNDTAPGKHRHDNVWKQRKCHGKSIRKTVSDYSCDKSGTSVPRKRFRDKLRMRDMPCRLLAAKLLVVAAFAVCVCGDMTHCKRAYIRHIPHPRMAHFNVQIRRKSRKAFGQERI